MHGHIGELKRRAENGHDLDTCRRLSNGAIDYDFYRRRAYAERQRVMRQAFGPLAPLMRPLIAVAAVVAAIWMMPAPG